MAISVRPYQRPFLPGVVALCEAEGWPSFPADPERAHRAMTAPGVTTVVSVDDPDGLVVGFACLQSDGEIQAHLSLIAVERGHRRGGIARSLIGAALARAGGQRIDLVTDSADPFYARLMHRRLAGYRLFPPFEPEAAINRDPPHARPVNDGDRDWVVEVLTQRWAGPEIVSRGRRHHAARLPGMVVEIGRERVGLATYRIEGDETEVVSLDALVQGRGIGSALLQAVAERARAAHCRRLWLITTNDNLDAVRFYQRRGLRLVAVHRGAVDEARLLKPGIREIGESGIAIHDEVELEQVLPSGTQVGLDQMR